MSTKYLLFLSVIFTLGLTSCKSEFERIRTSGNPELLYKSADNYYENEEYQRAQTLYELVIGSYRGKKEAEDIYYKYAYTYYHLENYILASYYFKNFTQTYTSSPKREEIEFMSAYSNYQLSPTFRLDQTYTDKAIGEFQTFVNTYPNSERVEQCNQLIDEMRAKLERKALEEGQLYFDLRQYQAAVQVFENMLKDFPETDNVEDIRFKIVQASFLLAENSVIEKQRERFNETLTLASEYNTRFETNTKEVERMVDQSNEKLKQLENVGY